MISINNGNSSTQQAGSSRLRQLRVELNRASLNLALVKQHQQQQQQQQQQQGHHDGPASGNLSPSILINAENGGGLVTSINNAMTMTLQPEAGVQVSVAEPEQPTKIESPRCTSLGNYVFVEPAAVTDTFGTAYHTNTKQAFFWKKFNRRDYMRKLEAYFIMEGASEHIYKFSEIVLQSNYAGPDDDQHDDAVYVLFEPHHGDLHSFMKERKRLDEPEARHIFRQCVEAVHACHENGIIIRDIKLKKFVFLDPERTKIGLANLEDCLLLDEDAENDLIKSQQGCPAYVSPEVLNPIQTSYSGKLSDSWSLGIILYTLLVGRYPFHHPTIVNMFARIARGKFQVPMPISLSMDARILLRSLIRVKPDERLRPDEILAHNWFRQNENECRVMRAGLGASTTAYAAVGCGVKTSKLLLGVRPPPPPPPVPPAATTTTAIDRDDACVPEMVVPE